MRSKDVLKDALKEFDGTVILVSHDREFLSGLASKVYEFGNKRVKEHLGGIYEFLERKKIENLTELERTFKSLNSLDSLSSLKSLNRSKSDLNQSKRKYLKKRIITFYQVINAHSERNNY
jgi:ATP-binding cassette subfamily F protein 3